MRRREFAAGNTSIGLAENPLRIEAQFLNEWRRRLLSALASVFLASAVLRKLSNLAPAKQIRFIKPAANTDDQVPETEFWRRVPLRLRIMDELREELLC